VFVYYESIKRELKRRLIYEYRCDERLKTKTEESTRLGDTRLVLELEHLKIKTTLIDEKFASVRGECDVGSGTVHCCVPEVEILKLKKKRSVSR
jgi:hypothetical protein